MQKKNHQQKNVFIMCKQLNGSVLKSFKHEWPGPKLTCRPLVGNENIVLSQKFRYLYFTCVTRFEVSRVQKKWYLRILPCVRVISWSLCLQSEISQNIVYLRLSSQIRLTSLVKISKTDMFWQSINETGNTYLKNDSNVDTKISYQMHF